MWIVPLHERLHPEQWTAWQGIQHAALELLRDGDLDDPWLFHGTAAIQAGWVLRNGFEPQHLFGAMGHGLPLEEGVYWGHPAIAAHFAERAADTDNLPAIFAARASDVARSTPDGLLHPDYFAAAEQGCPRSYPDGLRYDSPELPSYRLGTAGDCSRLPPNENGGIVPETWQQSLAAAGAVTAPDGRHVPHLALLCIPGHLPHHPDAAHRRIRRLAETHPLLRQARHGGQLPPGMEHSLDPRDTRGARALPHHGDLRDMSRQPTQSLSTG